MPISNELTPPPKIGNIGPYTVFATPPATPNSSNLVSEFPRRSVPSPPVQLPPQPVLSPPVRYGKAVAPSPPPVHAPPFRHAKPAPSPPLEGSSFAFFWDAVAKVQNAHSSVDEFVACWFGLNKSKYQWALDDYYESKDHLKQNICL